MTDAEFLKEDDFVIELGDFPYGSGSARRAGRTRSGSARRSVRFTTGAGYTPEGWRFAGGRPTPSSIRSAWGGSDPGT